MRWFVRALVLSVPLVIACGGGGPEWTGHGEADEAGAGAPDARSPGKGGKPEPEAGTIDSPAPETGGDSQLPNAQPLVFAAVGDTRPAIPDDEAGYPTPIIDRIFTDIEGLTPQPSLVVGTGDYQFSDPWIGLASSQLDLYMAARAKFSGAFYPTMGNHECTSLTTSNCGKGNADGVTNTYSEFLSKMLTPIKEKLPYYVQHVSASDGSWTAKFVFVAANAWDSAQETWLDTALSETTKYTFIVRHEPASANTAPGTTPSETVMAKHPYTLAIVGHVHTYEKSGAREVTVGNGGAPLDDKVDYGFGLFSMRADGAIVVSMIDYMSGMASQTFAVNPDGSAAP